jgi:hypothetical protein
LDLAKFKQKQKKSIAISVSKLNGFAERVISKGIIAAVQLNFHLQFADTG